MKSDIIVSILWFAAMIMLLVVSIFNFANGAILAGALYMMASSLDGISAFIWFKTWLRHRKFLSR